MLSRYHQRNLLDSIILHVQFLNYSFLIGCLLLGLLLPIVGPVVFGAMLWEALDRGWKGGFIGSNLELTGVIFKLATLTNHIMHPFNVRWVKNPADSFYMNCIYLQGIIIPIAFLYCCSSNTLYGFSPVLCYFYHLFRIGPYFMNFAYYYTLCHKEGHTREGFYSEPLNSFLLSRNVFNW